MVKYFVLRNKNTGLYFRGKGVNRWGKYYNQASVYRLKANAENAIKEIAWHGEQAEIVPIKIFDATADVVEVVRCKDCKYWKHEEDVDFVCTRHYGYRLSSDFCSYGERKERTSDTNNATND